MQAPGPVATNARDAVIFVEDTKPRLHVQLGNLVDYDYRTSVGKTLLFPTSLYRDLGTCHIYNQERGFLVDAADKSRTCARSNVDPYSFEDIVKGDPSTVEALRKRAPVNLTIASPLLAVTMPDVNITTPPKERAEKVGVYIENTKAVLKEANHLAIARPDSTIINPERITVLSADVRGAESEDADGRTMTEFMYAMCLRLKDSANPTTTAVAAVPLCHRDLMDISLYFARRFVAHGGRAAYSSFNVTNPPSGAGGGATHRTQTRALIYAPAVYAALQEMQPAVFKELIWGFIQDARPDLMNRETLDACAITLHNDLAPVRRRLKKAAESKIPDELGPDGQTVINTAPAKKADKADKEVVVQKPPKQAAAEMEVDLDAPSEGEEGEGVGGGADGDDGESVDSFDIVIQSKKAPDVPAKAPAPPPTVPKAPVKKAVATAPASAPATTEATSNKKTAVEAAPPVKKNAEVAKAAEVTTAEAPPAKKDAEAVKTKKRKAKEAEKGEGEGGDDEERGTSKHASARGDAIVAGSVAEALTLTPADAPVQKAVKRPKTVTSAAAPSTGGDRGAAANGHTAASAMPGVAGGVLDCLLRVGYTLYRDRVSKAAPGVPVYKMSEPMYDLVHNGILHADHSGSNLVANVFGMLFEHFPEEMAQLYAPPVAAPTVTSPMEL